MLSDKMIVCIDVESNGFRGEGFAVGAVVMDMEGKIPQAYLCRTMLSGHPVEWVLQNVMPALADVKNTHTTAVDMRRDFMHWLSWIATQYEIEVFADWTYPVDGRFLISAMDEMRAPLKYRIPIVHEVATLLLALGMDVDLDRYEFVKDEMKGEMKKHNPLWDAEVSARTARKLLKMLQERNMKAVNTVTANYPFPLRGVETGRTQASEPNIANVPKVPDMGVDEVEATLRLLQVGPVPSIGSNGAEVK